MLEYKVFWPFHIIVNEYIRSQEMLSSILHLVTYTYIINPWRACAAKVTVIVSCVCVCMYVCPHTLFWQYTQLEV